MGWGIGDWLSDIVDDVLGRTTGGGAASETLSRNFRESVGSRVDTAGWQLVFPPIDRGNFFSYEGGRSYQSRIGWRIEIGVAAYGGPGVVPEGVFFIGHAIPGMSFDSLSMTQTGADLVDDYFLNGGLVARLVQKDENGKIIYINGYETGVDRAATIFREDLALSLKSPLRVTESYGGDIIPYLPMYITVSKFGNTGSATGIDTLQAQVTASFFVHQVQ